MPEWVIAISVGPVGDFIGGGRRSRDLWWGSTWISECTLAAARELPEAGLIVPIASRVQKLRQLEIVEEDGTRTWANWRYGGRISNHLLARVECQDVEELARLLRRCEAAAHRHLADQLRNARKVVEARGGKARQAIEKVADRELFDRQVEAIERGEFVELFAAWTLLDGGLPAAISRVRKILDARKTARLFEAPRITRSGRRKSDLDAGRDSVLHSSRIRENGNGTREAEQHLARRRLGIGTDEELDAVGLARRIAMFQRDAGVPPELGRLPFPPVNRVAVDPWIRRADQDPGTRQDLDLVKKILRKARQDEIFFTWCSPALDPETAWEERDDRPECFPFDTSFLMEGGLEALYREVERVGRRLHDRREVEETLRFLDELTPPVRRLQSAHGMPPPYFALLFMDGDGVGRALENASGGDALADLVRQLDDYADKAEPLLRKEHLGRAFYIGGDDLAAYLPVDKALGAAVALADMFRRSVQSPQGSLTLSAGIVIGHVKADLRSLRRQAQEALSGAKKKRAGAGKSDGWLQIVELPRSGSVRSCAGPLEELAGRMEQWQQLLADGSLSLRSPRLLLGLKERFAGPEEKDGGDLGIELARHRIWAQIERSSKKQNDALQAYVEKLGTWRQAEDLANELAIAARFHRIRSLRPAGERGAET